MEYIQDKYILVCVHFPSKTHCERKKKDIVIRRVIQEIQKLEEESACQNTIVVGDFNENPYEGGCLAADGFHGLPDYYVAQREHRKILGEEFKMFYNPMWNFLGDFCEPFGTYYRSSSDTVNQYWNVYDQVIIRPILRKQFVDSSLKIITETATISLLDKNRHPDCDISDHLPITFEIKEANHE